MKLVDDDHDDYFVNYLVEYYYFHQLGIIPHVDQLQAMYQQLKNLFVVHLNDQPKKFFIKKILLKFLLCLKYKKEINY
jgi:hypothetical protein